MTIKLSSNAKINLALSINHKRADGYHDISSIMQEIDLCDIIELSKNDSDKINIISKGIKVPEDDSNLCYIATKIFFRTTCTQNESFANRNTSPSKNIN